jgi:hypothetical protein
MEIDVLYGDDAWLLKGELISIKNDNEALVKITDKDFYKWMYDCETDEELEEELKDDEFGSDGFVVEARLLDESLRVRNDEYCYCQKGFIKDSDLVKNENWFTFVSERVKEPTEAELLQSKKSLELFLAFNSRFGNV